MCAHVQWLQGKYICLPSWWRKTPAFQRSLRTRAFCWTLNSVTAQVCESLLAQCSYPCLLLLSVFMLGGKRGPDFPHYWDLFQGTWMLQIPREWRDLMTSSDTPVTCQAFPKQQGSNMLGWSSRVAQVACTLWVLLICPLDVGQSLNNLCGQQPVTDA